MTLEQLTDYVCEKSGLTEDEDRSACKDFLSKRYELIYNSYLWKDSLVGVDVTVDPVNNADNAEGVLLLPEVIDRVVAIRTPDDGGTLGRSVKVRGLEDFYRVDYDKFSKTGLPYEFALLSPIWFVARTYAGLRVVIQPEDSAQIKITWRDETGRRFVQQVQNGAGIMPAGPVTNLVPNGAVYDGDGIYSLSLTVGQKYFYYDPNFNGTGTFLNNGATQPVVPNGSVFTARAGCVLTGPGPGVAVTAQIYATQYRLEIERVFKQVTNLPVLFSPNAPGDVVAQQLAETDTRSPAYQRVRLFNIPTGVITLKVLGKKKFVPLDFDQEEPEIKNLDNCLIAFAMGDMLKRARQFGKAQSELQEGAALLAELAKLETVQAAHNSRIVPDGGYGDVYFGPGQRSYTEML